MLRPPLRSWLNLMGSRLAAKYWRMAFRQVSGAHLTESSISRLTCASQTAKSSSLKNWERQGCLRASSALGRRQLEKESSWQIRSRQQGSASAPNTSLGLLGRTGPICFSRDSATAEFICPMSLALGRPTTCTILSAWAGIDWQLKRGCSRHISARMQPRLHRSALQSQECDPSSTSGARYQRVATPSVSTGSSPGLAPRCRTSPKSQSLRWHWLERRRLEGLRSRWTSWAECRQCRASRAWQTMQRRWTSCSCLSQMRRCRSVGRHSKVRQRSLPDCESITSCSLTMLGCLTFLRIDTSRKVRWASVLCWKASNTFLRATVWAGLSLGRASHTTPQAPAPSFLPILNLLLTSASTASWSAECMCCPTVVNNKLTASSTLSLYFNRSQSNMREKSPNDLARVLGGSAEGRSMEDYSHAHPYEYLTRMNEVFSGYSRSNVPDYSVVSKVRLPFKPFNHMRVPDCFAHSYAEEQRELVHQTPLAEQLPDDAEKRLWREHRDIMQRYRRGKEERKRTARPLSSAKNRTREVLLRRTADGSRPLDYDQAKLEEEVLGKLKSIRQKGVKRGLSRCQTAKHMGESGGSVVRRAKPEEWVAPKISEEDYLCERGEEEMIVRYKGLIKQADCSISGKSIDRTEALLGRMQGVVDAEYL